MALMESSSHRPQDIGRGRKPVLPPPGQKWSQAEVHYRPKVKPGGCSACEHFDAMRSHCQVVAGFVQKDGCCDFFNDDAFPPPPVTKFDSGYVRVPGAVYQCGDCTYFNDGTCQIVDGPIDTGGACWEWNGEPGEVGQARLGQSIADNVPNEPPVTGDITGE